MRNTRLNGMLLQSNLPNAGQLMQDHLERWEDGYYQIVLVSRPENGEPVVVGVSPQITVGNPQEVAATDAVIANRSYEVASAAANALVTATSLAESKEATTSQNTMIIVIYGSNQFPGDGSGFDKLVEALHKDYKEVWAFSPGLNPRAGSIAFTVGPSPAETQPDIERFIESRLQQNNDLKNVVVIGYSWGDGVAHDVAEWLSKNHPNVHIAASVYVDAVNDDYSAGAENRMPVGTQAMLNIYQSRSHAEEGYVNGGPIENTTNLQDFIEIDTDRIEERHSHETIDKESVDSIIEFVQQRVSITPPSTP